MVRKKTEMEQRLYPFCTIASRHGYDILCIMTDICPGKDWRLSDRGYCEARKRSIWRDMLSELPVSTRLMNVWMCDVAGGWDVELSVEGRVDWLSDARAW